MVPSSEIEELIVQLHKEKKTTREISKEVRKNFTFIGTVLRRRFPEEYVNNDINKTLSKEIQPLKLFKKGKDLVYVAARLDMKPEDVQKSYSDFLTLQSRYSLTEMHNELGNSLPSFVQAYKKLQRSGIGINRVVRIAEILDQLPRIENQYRELWNNVKNLFQLKDTLIGEINRLKNQIIQLQNYFNSLNNQYRIINGRRQVF